MRKTLVRSIAFGLQSNQPAETLAGLTPEDVLESFDGDGLDIILACIMGGDEEIEGYMGNFSDAPTLEECTEALKQARMEF